MTKVWMYDHDAAEQGTFWGLSFVRDKMGHISVSWLRRNANE